MQGGIGWVDLRTFPSSSTEVSFTKSFALMQGSARTGLLSCPTIPLFSRFSTRLERTDSRHQLSSPIQGKSGRFCKTFVGSESLAFSDFRESFLSNGAALDIVIRGLPINRISRSVYKHPQFGWGWNWDGMGKQETSFRSEASQSAWRPNMNTLHLYGRKLDLSSSLSQLHWTSKAEKWHRL